jgi:hypothetical protein
MALPVVVPTLLPQSVASLVLDAEGVSHREHVCVGDAGYSELLTGLWAAGDGFVVVEHDIAPWFGAVTQLAECDRDWCMFHYPKFGGMLTRGLGCTKFSRRLVRAYPELPAAWRDIGWRVLDGTVGAAVAEALRGERPDRHPLCYHQPPVAHARRRED